MSRNRYKTGRPQRSRLAFEQLETRRVLTSLTFITAPQTIAAGAASGIIKVELLDASGHLLNATSAITVNLSAPNGEFLSYPSNAVIHSVVIAKGTSSASFRFEDTVAGSPTITASSASVNNPGFQTETVTAGAATQIVIKPATTQPVTAGVPTPISIQLEDQFGNLAAAGTSSHIVTVTRTPHGPTWTVTTGTTTGQEITLFSTSTTGEFLSSATSTTPITSIVIPKGSTGIIVYYDDTTAGMPTVSVDGAGLGSASEVEDVTEAAAKLAFKSSPYTFTASTTPNLADQITVELLANDGSVAMATPVAGVTITLTSSDGTGMFYNSAGVPLGSSMTVTIPQTQSMVSFTFSDTKAGMPKITATSAPLTSATQTETVNPAAVTQLTFSPGATSFQSDASSPPITVTEKDAYGNPVLAGAGGQAIALMSSDPAHTGMFFDANGQNQTSIEITQNTSSAIFTYTDTTVGNYTLTATATGLGVSNTMPVSVTAVQPAQIAITPPANDTEVAGQMSGVFTVTLEDAGGNPIMATHNVTIDLSSTNPTGGAAPATGAMFFNSSNVQTNTITILATQSSATFTYEDTLAPSTPTLTATDITDGFPSVTTTTTITPAAATQAIFVPSTPQSVTAGTAFSGTVQLEDQFGNIATAGATPPTVTLSDGNMGGTFTPTTIPPGTLTFTTGASSEPFTYTNSTPGTYTLTMSSGTLTTTSTLSITETLAPGTGVAVTNNNFASPSAGSTGQQPITGFSNGWTFGNTSGNGGGGVAAIDSPSPQSAYFTANPPSGSQAAYMIAGGTISQNVDFSFTGTYTLSFWAIEPTPNLASAAVGVTIDGTTVILTPTTPTSNTVWQKFTTTAFSATAGLHTIEFISSGVLGSVISINDVSITST